MRTITSLIDEFVEDAPPSAPVAPWMRDVDFAINEVEQSRAERIGIEASGSRSKLLSLLSPLAGKDVEPKGK